MGRRAGLKVNVRRLVELRDKQGWSQEKLAELSGLATRVVWKAENDKGIDAKSFRKLCAVTEKHGLDRGELEEVAIVFDLVGEVGDMSEADQARIYREIYARAGAAGEVLVVKRERGSFRVTVRLSLDDARKIEAAFRAGKLGGLPVLGVFREPGPWWREPPARRFASLACSSAALACPLSMLLPVYAPPFYVAGIVLAAAGCALGYRRRATLLLPACGLLLNAAALAAWPKAVGVFGTPNGVEFRLADRDEKPAAAAPAAAAPPELAKLVFRYAEEGADKPAAARDLLVVRRGGDRQVLRFPAADQKELEEGSRRMREFEAVADQWLVDQTDGKGNEERGQERLNKAINKLMEEVTPHSAAPDRDYETPRGLQHISLQLGGEVILDADVVIPDRDRVVCTIVRSPGKKATVRFVPDITKVRK